MSGLQRGQPSPGEVCDLLDVRGPGVGPEAVMDLFEGLFLLAP